MGLDSVELIMDVEKHFSISTVSYTHLDVYKRQEIEKYIVRIYDFIINKE